MRVSVFEPKTLDALSAQLVQLDPSVQLVVGLSLSAEERDVFVQAAGAQVRPMVLLSPYAVDGAGAQGERGVWRLFATVPLIADALVSVGVEAGARKVGVVTVPGEGGAAIGEAIKASALARGARVVEIAPTSPATEWSALAARVKGWGADTLFLALSPTDVAQLTTHLAALGLWSAPPASFEGDLSAHRKPNHDLVRLLLWPSAYDPRLLKQAGRYVEGARGVTPFLRESHEFEALDAQTMEEIERGAQMVDPLLIDLVEGLDETLRVSLALGRPLKELLRDLTLAPALLPPLSFDGPDLLRALRVFEVSGQRFVSRERLAPSPIKGR